MVKPTASLEKQTPEAGVATQTVNTGELRVKDVNSNIGTIAMAKSNIDKPNATAAATVKGQSGALPGAEDVSDSSSLDSDSLKAPRERKLVGLKKKPRYWTTKEDELLAAAVECVEKEGVPRNVGDNMWKKVAAYVPKRAWRECLQRWTKVLVPGLKKGKWSRTEDNTLLALVNSQIKVNPLKICWPEVSKGMGYRSCKQCRERWINHLDPNVKKGDWTPEEDEKLLRVGTEYPAKWAKIARHIPGRTENTVKVRWKILKRQEWKEDEDRELLRLTAMYPRQWRAIAGYLPGRNERNVKQRLHTLSKQRPEAFSFLENLSSRKVLRNTPIKKRHGGVDALNDLSDRKRRKLSDSGEIDETAKPMKRKNPFSSSDQNGTASSKTLLATSAKAAGLELLLQTATQNKTTINNETSKLNGSALASNTTPTSTVFTPTSPQLNGLNPNLLGMYMPQSMQYPFQMGLSSQNAGGMTLPMVGQMPFMYPNPQLAYMAAMSGQLGLLKPDLPSASGKTQGQNASNAKAT